MLDDNVVAVRVLLGPDGSLQQAETLDWHTSARDPFFRSSAEAAMRAVKRCSPLKLPPNKHMVWRSMVLTFDPAVLLGQ